MTCAAVLVPPPIEHPVLDRLRDLRNLSDRLEDKPASYLLGRDAPKEFEPK